MEDLHKVFALPGWPTDLLAPKGLPSIGKIKERKKNLNDSTAVSLIRVKIEQD